MELYLGDCLEEMKKIPDGSVDLVLTDPPYELGFMGKSWDSTGIANNVDVWKECLRVLKPGGYLLSFGGTRTYHRMASAIEDAGFEVRDMIEWVYGSGFPKSLNIGKAVDKLQGNEREQTTNNVTCPDFPNPCNGHPTANRSLGGGANRHALPTKGSSEWEGWGTALKPAHEPICLARKPLAEKTVAENVLKYGTGGINIDESRVEYQGKEDFENTLKSNTGNIAGGTFKCSSKSMAKEEVITQLGRFPANLIHDNSEEVRECFPESSGRYGAVNTGNVKFSPADYGTGQKDSGGTKDSGNASRFFKSIIYQAKASKSDRGDGNNHPTVKPVALMEYLVTMTSRDGATILDPFMGSGTTGVACKNLNRNFIGIEMDEAYFNIAKERIDNA